MPPKKKAANGYTFAEPLPNGTVVEDIAKNRWRLGPSIGKGGFGEIYSAQEENAKGDKYPYVVKIEPHSNGPLFVEINFYIRHAKPADVENFKKEKGLKTFGMPVYYGSGSHEYKGQKYRFLVMDKFSTDLLKLYIENNKIFPVDTVFKIAIQLLDVLEYIHQRGYVHADIKAANVLLGASKDTVNTQVYLVDFGLATKFTVEDKFKPNPKKAHDGTIEFLSRDAHQGVQTRRGDLEILVYNLIQWLGCKLPWESDLTDPKVVQNSKEENMSSAQKMIKACFGTNPCPKAIVDFLNYLLKMKFNTEPDYKKIRNIFMAGVKEGGGTIGKPLQFSQGKTPSKRTRTPVSKNDDGELSKPKRGRRAKKEVILKQENGTNIDSHENQENGISGDDTPKPKSGRRVKKEESSEQDDEMDVAASHSDNDDVITKRKQNTAPARKKPLNRRVSKSLDNLASSAPFEGYTQAMKEIMLKKMGKADRKKRGKQQQKVETVADFQEDLTGYTDEMKELLLKKKAKAAPSKGRSKRGVQKTNPATGSEVETGSI